jgi:hypothetical protein
MLEHVILPWVLAPAGQYEKANEFEEVSVFEPVAIADKILGATFPASYKI